MKYVRWVLLIWVVAVWWYIERLHRRYTLFADEPSNTNDDVKTATSWCDNVAAARSNLNSSLNITYPCEEMPPATSAVVCFLTGGAEVGQEQKGAFSRIDYINGAMALGASLQKHVTRKDTHHLLLVRQGLSLSNDHIAILEAVGWSIGTAPNVELNPAYVPRFERHKTTYTKITAIGLSEYKCVLLMDADAIAIGSLDDLLGCDILDRPEYRVAGALDLYQGKWRYFNTGSILWRTSTEEMNRVYNLTRDSTFMKRFNSDQAFLNEVYPGVVGDMEGSAAKESWGAVRRLPWEYNAQTHVEVQQPEYWEKHLPDVKIIHFTQKKGWQCPFSDSPPAPQVMPPKKCEMEIPLCYCREGYRWWNFLLQAGT